MLFCLSLALDKQSMQSILQFTRTSGYSAVCAAWFLRRLLYRVHMSGSFSP